MSAAAMVGLERPQVRLLGHMTELVGLAGRHAPSVESYEQVRNLLNQASKDAAHGRHVQAEDALYQLRAEIEGFEVSVVQRRARQLMLAALCALADLQAEPVAPAALPLAVLTRRPGLAFLRSFGGARR